MLELESADQTERGQMDRMLVVVFDTSWRKDEPGIPDDLVGRVGTMIEPRDSAIYALLRMANPDIVGAQ